MTVRLLGRDAELATLRSLLDAARDGHQQLALVGGDPGIGKTSLVDALAATAADAGMGVAWGRCWEGGGGAPFWPWVQLLRSSLEHADDDVLAAVGPAGNELAQLIPELRTRMPALAPTSMSDSPDLRLRLFESVRTFLAAAAERAGGMVIVLDDIHAADEGSLQLLRFLARRGGAMPLLLVATYRTTEVVASESLKDAVDALSRCGPSLQLRGLALNDVSTLLDRAGSGVGSMHIGRVHAATDGNPFLVYEAARLLAAAAPDSRAEVALPSDARALIHRRLEPLPAEQRAVLVAGAVLGREFELRPLSQVLDRPPAELIDFLSGAVELAVVEEVQLGRWSFTHALLREALLDQLDSGDRARLHRRAGEVLQAIHGATDGPVLAQIAAHVYAALDAGGDVPHAVALCARAATVASAALAYEEATRWYQRALEALDLTEPADETQRYELLVAMAEIESRRGNVQSATSAYQQAIRVARSMGSVELAAQAAVLAAPRAVSDPLVIGALDDALCDLPEEDSALRARVLVSFAWVLLDSYLTSDVLLDISNQGLEMARRVGDLETQWRTLWLWHVNAARSPDALAARHRVASELMELAERSGDLERRQLARSCRASNLVLEGELARAGAEFETRLEEAEELRQPYHVWSATAALASLAINQGRLDEGERLARRAAAVGEEMDWVNAEVLLSGQLRRIRLHQGSFEEAERLALDALETWTVTGWDCGRQHPLLMGLIHRGHPAEARARLEKDVGPGVEKLFAVYHPDGTRVELTKRPGCCLAAVAELCWLLDDRDRAAALYEHLLPRQGWHIVGQDSASRGAADRYLGQLAALLGQFTEAEEHFEAAHRLHERMGTPIFGADGMTDHARMLTLRNGPGDRARAVELLADAAATFHRLGIDRREQLVRQRLASLLAAGNGLSLRRQGQSWSVAFHGVEVQAGDGKGMRYLARLVASPGQELHALDLVVGEGRGAVTNASEPAVNGGGDAGSVLDAQAKAAYRRRLEQLRASGEPSGAVRQEIDFLEAELGAAVGLGGRDRRVASDAERARQSVSRAIKDSVDRLADLDAGLGRHLRDAVRTGIYSSYSPE